jgi:hypothetical protein
MQKPLRFAPWSRITVHGYVRQCCSGAARAHRLAALLVVAMVSSAPGLVRADQTPPLPPSPSNEETQEPVRPSAQPTVQVAPGAGAEGTPPKAAERSAEPEQRLPPEDAEPAGAPPAVVGADPNWHQATEDIGAPEPTTMRPKTNVDLGLGVQLFGISGKLMSGLSFRFGKQLWWGEFELSPLWLTRNSAEFDGWLLGNQWGFYFSLAPLRSPRAELSGGVGLDVYHLWAIHRNEARLALSLKLRAQLWLTRNAGVFVTLRGYPVHSQGLELGVDRRGSKSVPLLGSLGAEWRFE